MGVYQPKKPEEMFKYWKSSPKSIPGVIYQLGRSIIDNWEYLKRLGVRKDLFITSIILYFVMYLFQTIGLGLLLPIAHGILNHDFNSILSIPFFNKVSVIFPSLITSGEMAIFLLLISIVFLSTAIKVVISYYSNIYLVRKKLKISTSASKYIFQKYLSFGKKFFDETTAGKETAIITSIPSTVISCIQILLETLNLMIEIALAYCLMLIISWKFAMLSLVFIPVFIVTTKLLNERMKDALKDDQDPEGVAEYSSVYNYFLRIPLMKAFNAEKYEEKLFHDSCENAESKKIRIEQVMSMHGPMTEIVMLVMLLAFVSILALVSFSSDKSQVASYLVIFLLFQTILKSTRNLTSKSLLITRRMTNLRKMMLDVEDIEKYTVSSGARKMRGLSKGITIKDLDFGYSQKRMILKGLSLDIPKGRFLAIVGKTGSGKSTLVSLLLRFYECPSSSIFIDDVDIREYNAESVRRNISFISQDTIIFNDTLYNNIIYGYPGDVDKKRFDEILVRSDLDVFVRKLPDGISSMIGDRGTTISGGEKQRIAIARALLRDSEIIIMDEPTSSLDSSTEKRIQDGLKDVFIGKTVIVIAHRLSTIMKADWIAVINNGKVEEQGECRRLLERKGSFYHLYEAQKLK